MTLSQLVALLTVVVLDASRHQVLIRGDVLKRNNVPAVILKASGGLWKDERFEQHYAGLQAAGVHTPAYHWLDPIYRAEQQIDVFLSIVGNRNIPFYVLDIEQWWNNWAAWYAAWAKKLIWSLVPKIAPYKIALHAHTAAQYLVAKARKPVLLYTSQGFVRSYAPQMAEWLGNFDGWPANYVIYSDKKITCSWDELYRKYLPTGKLPLLPDGMKPERVRGWQYSGDLISLPGMYADAKGKRYSPADLSVFDPNWLGQVLGETPVVTVPDEESPVEQYIVSDWVTRGLNFRKAPNTGAAVQMVLAARTRLTATGNTSGDWIEVEVDGRTGWVHTAYLTKLDGQPVIIEQPQTAEYYAVASWVYRGLRFRREPDDSTDTNILKVLTAGTRLEATGQTSSDWIEVKVDGLIGWVHKDYIFKL